MLADRLRIKTGVAWTPAELFAGGFNGAWYDPSDLSTLWQDTAGTNPVTTDGQVVSRMDDKSGNGNTILIQSGLPVWKTGGYVEMTSDYFRRSTIPFSSNIMCGIAARTTNSGVIQTILQNSSALSNLYVISSRPEGDIAAGRFNGSSYIDPKSHPHAGGDFAAVSDYNVTTLTQDYLYNGLAPNGTITPAGANLSFLSVGARSDGSLPIVNGRLYSVVIVVNRTTSAAERTLLSNYLRNKAGAF